MKIYYGLALFQGTIKNPSTIPCLEYGTNPLRWDLSVKKQELSIFTSP